LRGWELKGERLRQERLGEERLSEDRVISASTVLCGIVLHPAGHTRSPAMHNAAFRSLGIDAAYLAFDVPPERLEAALAGARALGIRQLAVSIPHKEAVMDALDEIDERARSIGAVNTVTLQGGRLVGSNTDWLGAVQALERETELTGRHCVVLGAGGTARAVVHGLTQRGARVDVLNRTRERAEALVAELKAGEAGGLEDLEKINFDVLVNTTSVGLRSQESPVPQEMLRPEAVVMDAVYDPEETRLLADARKIGAKTIGGKWMLIHQAAEQIRLWTGREAPIEVLAEAFDRAGVEAG
jgi:shikimate dehydrogenase